MSADGTMPDDAVLSPLGPALVDVPGIAHLFVDTIGYVYSSRRDLRCLSPYTDRDGYFRVSVTVSVGKYRAIGVHRLVAMAFHGLPPTPHHEARHLDGSRTNNAPSNLAWGTRRDNAADRERHGRTARGERNRGGVGLTSDEVTLIRQRLDEGVSQVAIGREFGIAQPTVSAIKVGHIWRAA